MTFYEFAGEHPWLVFFLAVLAFDVVVVAARAAIIVWGGRRR